ncbi:MAG: hypothetical protein ABH983_00640 [Candidatus Micrarchaeota archaeon]
MQNAQSRKADSSLQLRDGFKKATPLRESLQSLSRESIGDVLGLFSSRSKARDQLLRFLETREKLSREFGARIDLVKEPGSERVSVRARLEMQTSDRTLDLDTEQLVVSRGFSLMLATKPVTGPDSFETILVDNGGFEKTEFNRQRLDGVYVVSESPTHPQSSPERISAYAEALLALAKDLAEPLEEYASPASSNVISMPSASSREVPQSSPFPELAAVSTLKTKL